MRPRKVILLVDPREDRRSITRFVLRNQSNNRFSGYRVIDCSSCFEASEIAHNASYPVDLMLGYMPVSDEYLMDVAAGLHCPWLYIGPTEGKMADVLERIRLNIKGKRGPRPTITQRSTGNHYGPRIGRFVKEQREAVSL